MKFHTTVLKKEAVLALGLTPKSTVVDATFGSGGHASLIVSSLTKGGTFVGIDADRNAIQNGTSIIASTKCTTHLVIGNYRDIDSTLVHLHIQKVDAILADLGWRMEQFSGSGKGFSFAVDEPLIMTYGDKDTYPFVARDIVNEWKVQDLINILRGYGEERFARRIAEAIVTQREIAPLETTFDLVEVIKKAVPTKYQHGRIHPATRTFQALRITVNDELDALKAFVKSSIELLKEDGRLAIITFHSIEDRIVKHLFKDYERDQRGRVVTKKPIVPTLEERDNNPRSRSAKLRIFEKHEAI